jgi:hypothetical protein
MGVFNKLQPGIAREVKLALIFSDAPKPSGLYGRLVGNQVSIVHIFVPFTVSL